MTNRAFLIRAGISLALLSALPLFASASILGMNRAAEPVVATEAFSKVGEQALAAADESARTVASDASAAAVASVAPSFSGDYAGSGKAADSNGWESDCASTTMSIADSASDVKLFNQKYSCGSLGAIHDPIQLLKKPDGLYLGNKKVGLYSDTEIDAMLPFEHLSGVSFAVRLIKKGDSLVYTEDWLSLQDGALDQVFEMGSTLKAATPTAIR